MKSKNFSKKKLDEFCNDFSEKRQENKMIRF